MSAETKLTAARLTVLLKEPFFGALVHGLKLKADPTCKTAWVDGRTLGYNPTFIESLTHDRVVGTYVHEISHCAQGHPWRRGGRDPKLWNIACDKVINGLLRDAKFTLPDGVYYAEGEELGKSAEWIYARLAAKEAEEQAAEQAQEQAEQEQEEEQADDEDTEGGDGEGDEEGDEPDDSQDGDGEGEGDADEEGDGEGQGKGQDDGDGDGDGEGQGDGDGKQGGQADGQGGGAGDGTDTEDDELGEVRDAPADTDEDGDAAPTEQEWKERVMVAYQTAQAQGKGSDGLTRAVQDAIRPRVDPRSLLLRFFTERAAADYSWRTPNARYQAHGLYLPALRENTLGRIAILCDTSGSMDETSLGFARGIVESVIEECKPASVDLYYVDAAVCGHDHFEQGEPLDWRPSGGGGTDFTTFFAEIEKSDEQPICIIGISDLQATFPASEPEVPVLWLVTPNPYAWAPSNVQAPWGETVNLEV